MSLRTVEIFCEVAQQRSFSKAAGLRAVSQSYASQAVRELEAELNVQLIDRSKRPLELTPEGVVYFEGCQRVLEDFRLVNERVRQMANHVVGVLKVAAIYSVGLLQMGDCKRRFQDEFPDAVLKLDYRRPADVYESVLSGNADLGLVSFPEAKDDLVVLPWITQNVVLVVPTGHPLSFQNRVSPHDFAEEVFVTFTPELTFRRKLDRWLRSSGVHVPIGAEFDNIAMIKSAVAAGSGIALLPEATVREDVKLGQLQTVVVQDDTTSEDAHWVRPVGIIHKRSRSLPLPAQKFVGLLEAQADAFREAK